MMEYQHGDEMAAVLLEQFEAWVSMQPNSEQLLTAMDLVEEALVEGSVVPVEEWWNVSEAALMVARAASGVARFAPIAVTYQTIARRLRVGAASRGGGQ